jgi:heptosyltransferase-2
MTLAVALPNWVGDAVMATPALRALRERFPQERVVAVARPTVRAVLDPNPWINAYMESCKSNSDVHRAARALATEAPQVGLLMPNSLRSALVFRLAGVPRRIGYARGGRGFLLTDRLRAEKREGRFVPASMIAYYLRLAGVLGARTDDRRMELFTTEADEAAAEAAYRAAGLDPAATLLVCPGYSFGPSKAWPAAHWAALARGARERFGLGSAILCSPDEAPIAHAILDAGGPCATLYDKGVGLSAARAVVRRARAMVAIDSGLRHFAAAFNRPVVALFGSTHVEWTETWYPGEVRLQGVAPCGPCQEPVCPTGTCECMYKIQPEEALDALAEALRRGAVGA